MIIPQTDNVAGNMARFKGIVIIERDLIPQPLHANGQLSPQQEFYLAQEDLVHCFAVFAGAGAVAIGHEEPFPKARQFLLQTLVNMVAESHSFLAQFRPQRL